MSVRTRLIQAFCAVLAACLAFAPTAQACTGMMLQAKDGGVVTGRTLEFGVDPQSNIVAIPSGYQATGTLPNNAKGLSFKTKYGIVGANGFGMQNAMLDGINEAGLYVGLFYFPQFANYTPVDGKNAAKGLAPWEFGLWALGTNATVDEVKANLKNIVLAPTYLDVLKTVPPVHFLVRDKSGKSIVIEPIDGVLKVYDNPIGVMANAPPFDWHMTNLRNYLNLSVASPAPKTITGVTLTPLGFGGGLAGMPGDFGSPSRFVRAAVFSRAALPSATSSDAVTQLFHLLNNFDIPVGSDGPPAGYAGADYEFTAWTAVADLATGRYHFRTYKDQTIAMVDLKAALAMAKGKPMTVPMAGKQPIVDVTANLRPVGN
ncbi:MAG: linear amide C-N hydrolase [Alphaproteobacteria bacterium]